MILLKFALYMLGVLLLGAVIFEVSYVIYNGIVYPDMYRDREDWFDDERRNIETYFMHNEIEIINRDEDYFKEDIS